MERNRALEKMKAGEFVLGLQIRSRSPLIAELAGYLGFDYLYIETEHFACNDETVEELVRAAMLTGITPWVRITSDNPEVIGRMLDLGAQGVILPHLETPEQALRLVDAVKYPPLGHRGHCMVSRAACYGRMESEDYVAAANRNCSSLGMIETVRGVENLEAILSQGIDLIRVGRGDLSLDMGLLGQQKAPRFVEMLRSITDMAKKYNVPVGTSATDVESALYYKSLGFSYLTIVSDLDYLKRTLPSFLNSVRDALR